MTDWAQPRIRIRVPIWVGSSDCIAVSASEPTGADGQRLGMIDVRFTAREFVPPVDLERRRRTGPLYFSRLTSRPRIDETTTKAQRLHTNGRRSLRRGQPGFPAGIQSSHESSLITGGMSMSQALTPYGSSIVAVYPDHDSAEHAIRLLHKEGFALEDLSIIGRDIQMSEEPTGFVSTGDYVSAGAVGGTVRRACGGLLGAALLVLPGVGPIVVTGPLAAAVLAGIEGALAGVAVGASAGRSSAGACRGSTPSSTNQRSRVVSTWCSRGATPKKSPVPGRAKTAHRSKSRFTTTQRPDERLHELPDHAAVIVDLDGPSVGSLVDRIERDAQTLVDRRGNVFRVIGGLGGLLGERIGLTDGDSSTEAAAGQQGDARRRPVVAAGRRIHLGGAAKVAQDHDQRLLEHAAVGEVLHQPGDCGVEPGKKPGFHRLEVVLVRVPAAIGDGDEANAAFDQTACEQAALSQGISPVTVAQAGTFGMDVKCLLRLRSRDQVKGFLVEGAGCL